jgi:hypothetical protein
MATRMLQRRGTASQWTSANTVLAAGEFGVETDTGQFKIGDGTTGWNSLAYFKDTIDLNIDLKAPIASPTFTGNVVLPSTTVIGNVSAAELAILDGVTASASEINVLDGITASTNELNILDGVTADASEINRLDGLLASTTELNTLVGITASAAELNILDGATLSTAELNILDGVTATASELNVLDGITATVSELNVLDGVTVTTTELNYLDGVTASIQTQLSELAPLDDPALTGDATAENLTITGNLVVQGTTTTVDATNLEVTDSLIYLAAEQYDTDVLDIGIFGAYGDSNPGHEHTGLVRDATDGTWKLISGAAEPTSNEVNFSGVVYDTLKIGALETADITATGDVDFSAATVTGIDALPSQSGNTGKYLTTDGSTASWATLNASPAMDDLSDVTVTSATANDVVYYNGTGWVNKYVASIPTLTNAQSGTTYTLALGDAGKIVEVGNASAITVTIPTNASVAYPIGTQITLLQTGAGQITVSGPSGGTLNATPGTKLRAQWSSATLLKRATDTWVLIGDLTA